MTFSLHFSWPPAGLFKNSHVGWRQKAILTKNARAQAYLQTLAKLANGDSIPPPKWHLVLQATYPNGRRRDLENICVKSYIDGMMDGFASKGDRFMYDDRHIVKFEAVFMGIDPVKKGFIDLILTNAQNVQESL